jgi:hypothetical protein
MKTNPTQTKLKLLLLCVLSVSALNFSAFAQEQDYPYWIAPGNGYWHEAGNWDGGSIPTSNSITYVQNSGTAIISYGSDAQAKTLYVGGADPGTLDIHGGLEVFGTTVIDGAELSTVIMNGSTWYNHNNIQIGGQGEGMLILQSGTVYASELNSDGVLVIGGDGSGRLSNYSGGFMNITSRYYGGTVRFAHSGTINFANVIGSAGINIEQNGPGSTTLTASYSYIYNLQVKQGNLNLAEGTVLALGGNATVSNGGYLSGAGTLAYGLGLLVESGGVLSTTLTLTDGLTLEAGAVLDYAGNSGGLLVTGGFISVENGVIVDFGGVTVGDGDEFIVLDWNGVTSSNISETSFTTTNLGADMAGSFTVANKQLTFTASAIPEPSTYFLMGAGLALLLLTAHYRRRKAQS